MWESIVSFGTALVDKWLLIVAGVLIPVLVDVPSMFFDKWEKWVSEHKLTVRKYRVGFFIVVLFIASFLVFHEERLAHKETNIEFTEYKGKYSPLAFDELKEDIKGIKERENHWDKEEQEKLIEEKIDKWAKEVSIDGDIGIGQWDGNVFVYHQPLLVFTKLVTWQDSLKPFVFTIDGEGAPELNSLVTWRVDIDRATERVNAIITHAHGIAAEVLLDIKKNNRGEFSSAISMSEDRKMALVAKIEKGTVPVILRVYITSYEVNNKYVNKHYKRIKN